MTYLTNKEGSSPSINILLIIHKKSIKFSLYTFQLVPRPAFEILNVGTFQLILLKSITKYKYLIINDIK